MCRFTRRLSLSLLQLGGLLAVAGAASPNFNIQNDRQQEDGVPPSSLGVSSRRRGRSQELQRELRMQAQPQTLQQQYMLQQRQQPQQQQQQQYKPQPQQQQYMLQQKQQQQQYILQQKQQQQQQYILQQQRLQQQQQQYMLQQKQQQQQRQYIVQQQQQQKQPSSLALPLSQTSTNGQPKSLPNHQQQQLQQLQQNQLQQQQPQTQQQQQLQKQQYYQQQPQPQRQEQGQQRTPQQPPSSEVVQEETQWIVKTDSTNTTQKLFNITGLKWAEIQQLHVTLDRDPPKDADSPSYHFANYRQAPTEAYIFDNIKALGYDTELEDNAITCQIWQETEFKWQRDWYRNKIYEDLHTYRQELQDYYEAIGSVTLRDPITGKVIRDIRKHLVKDKSKNKGTCSRLHLKKPPGAMARSASQFLRGSNAAQKNQYSEPSNLQETFFPRGKLSYISNSSGWIEPLLPPLRHPNYCYHKRGDPENLDALTLTYLVHDFAAMCESLEPTSRIVLVDLGASPKFWEFASPVWELVALYERFGFTFDHIYAFEKKVSTQDTGSAGPLTTMQHYARNGDESVEAIYKRVPRHLHHAYHWIHSAVNIEPNHELNPFTWIEQEFRPEDLVIVKMDIGPSNHEVVLVEQLLKSDKLLSLVDHLYWEHKVHVHETSRHWGGQMIGSVKDSLELFALLREKGVAAHYWV